MLLSYPLYLLLNNDVPAKSVAELVALGKAQPGKLNMGSVGTGGAGHLAIEMFKNVTGISAVHVPYKGAGPAQNRSHGRGDPLPVRQHREVRRRLWMPESSGELP